MWVILNVEKIDLLIGVLSVESLEARILYFVVADLLVKFVFDEICESQRFQCKIQQEQILLYMYLPSAKYSSLFDIVGLWNL